MLITRASSGEGLRRTLKETLAAEIDHFYDLEPYMKEVSHGREILNPIDGHWNQLGNELAADGIFEALNEEFAGAFSSEGS